MKLFNQPKFIKERVYRVKINFTGGYSCGSGFFITPNQFLTCAHVVFGSELKNFKNDQLFTVLIGSNEHEKLLTLYNQKITKIEIELKNGNWVNASLKEFDEKYDVVLLDVSIGDKKINICKINLIPNLSYGSYIYFGGFPSSSGYEIDKSPFAIHEGIISSFPEIIVGGEKYGHIQINSINLGGNSGAPLFLKGSKKVIGIINGNMNMGNDNTLFRNPKTNQIEKNSFRIPLNVAYATPINLLKAKTLILKNIKLN